jgi:hypothetical protein
MPSHFSTIGFDVPTPEAFQSLVNLAAQNGYQLLTENGNAYFHWKTWEGAELWVQVNAENELIGVQPHFAGKGIVRVRLINSVERENNSSLDGAWKGWANPPEDASNGDGDYPFVFDAPDFRLHAKGPLPRIESVQLAAFAHELSLFESEQAFHDSQAEKTLKYSHESFIPSGLFVTEGPPASTAMFTGVIVEASLRANEAGGGKFWWMLVKTLGGEIDVVADAVLVTAEPCIGGILQGSFWLTGRIARPDGLALM